MVGTRRSARLSASEAKSEKTAPAKQTKPKKAPPKKAKTTKTKATTTSVKKTKEVSKDAPPKDAPAKDSPAKDAPAKDAPAKDAPAPSTKTDATPTTSSKPDSDGKKVVTVEACKQWGAFKSRSNKIAKAVGDRAIVEINKEKPGKGNFVVTIEGIDEPIVSLLGLKRPFPALKALDMDEINAKIIAALE